MANRTSMSPAGGAKSVTVYKFPGRVLQVYLLATVGLFLIGPQKWTVGNPWPVVIYALAGQLAIYFGYQYGCRRKAFGLAMGGYAAAALKIAFYLWPVVGLVRFFDKHASLGTVVDALADPAAVYAAHAEALSVREQVTPLTLVLAALGPLSALAFASGLVFWRQLSYRRRCLWGIGLFMHLTGAVATGTAKNIFDLVLSAPFLIRAGDCMHESRQQKPLTIDRVKGRHSKKRILAAATLLLVTVSGLTYFFYTRLARYGGSYPIGTVGWSLDLWGFPLPDLLEYAIAICTGYLCQGYYGLAGCLELPFVWTWGLGHSDVLSRYASNYIGEPGCFRELTYPARYELLSGYRVGHHWHTIYPWLASDVTFLGALVVVGICGYLLARSWRDLLDSQNPFAAAFFLQIALLMFFIPMHSSRLAWSEELISFWVLLALWQATSAKKSALKRPFTLPTPSGSVTTLIPKTGPGQELNRYVSKENM